MLPYHLTEWFQRRNRRILRDYYERRWTMDRIARKYGLTRQRIVQIIDRKNGGAK